MSMPEYGNTILGQTLLTQYIMYINIEAVIQAV